MHDLPTYHLSILASYFAKERLSLGMFTSALVLGEMLWWQHYTALALVILGVSLGTGALPLPSLSVRKKKVVEN